MFSQDKKHLFAAFICMLLILAVTAYIVQYNALQKKADNGVEVAVQEVSPSKEPYGKEEVTYPYWKGYVDDTLAMNHMYSFLGYHGQGSLRRHGSGQPEADPGGSGRKNPPGRGSSVCQERTEQTGALYAHG